MRKFLRPQEVPPQGATSGWDSMYRSTLLYLQQRGFESDWRYVYLRQSQKTPEDALRRLSWLSMADVQRDIP